MQLLAVAAVWLLFAAAAAVVSCAAVGRGVVLVHAWVLNGMLLTRPGLLSGLVLGLEPTLAPVAT